MEVTKDVTGGNLDSNNDSDKIEVESRIMKVDRKTYYVDFLKGEKGQLIKLVEVLKDRKKNRIIVPLVIAPNFVNKLKEISIAHNEIPENEVTFDNAKQQFGDENSRIIKASFMSSSGRKFYFDLKQFKNGFRRLRISFVSTKSRININIPADAVDEFVNIFQEFIDANPLANKTIKKEVSTKKSEVSKDLSEVKGENLKSENTKKVVRTTQFKDKMNNRASLSVQEEPKPVKINLEHKDYVFEVVKGEKVSYLRVSELIKEKRKCSLHIPIEGSEEFKKALAAFVSGITPEQMKPTKTEE